MTHSGGGGVGEMRKRCDSHTARYLQCHDRDGSYGKLVALRSQQARGNAMRVNAVFWLGEELACLGRGVQSFPFRLSEAAQLPPVTTRARSHNAL